MANYLPPPGDSGGKAENASPNALTSIHRRIHCGPAQEGLDDNEAERLMVRHFLETLAGIALSVASRKVKL